MSGNFSVCLNLWLHGIIGHTSIGSDAGGGFRCAAVHQHSPTPIIYVELFVRIHGIQREGRRGRGRGGH